MPRLAIALLVGLAHFAADGRASAQDATVVLLEDTELTENRLHYPMVITGGRGYRIRCRSQAAEEAVIRGLGFATVPSQVVTPLDPTVAAADPLGNPLLCPSAEDYPIKAFAHRGPEGMKHYLQFPEGFGAATFTDRIYVPGCVGLVDALALDLGTAIDADPSPFFAGKIHDIACIAGAPIQAEPTRFAEWCMKQDLSPAEAPTVSAILEATPGGVTALGQAAPCAAAETFLRAITRLNLNGAGVRSLKPVAVLTHLTSLSLGENGIDDVAPLAGLTALTFLDLSGNAIANISALAPMLALGELDLSDNQIANIRPLASLAALRALDLSRNRVGELDPLAFLEALSRLSLAGNALTGDMLEPLTAIGTLAELDLSDNAIESFEHLGQFPSTLEIVLTGNPIVAIDQASFANLCILHRDDPSPFGLTIRAMIEVSGRDTCGDAGNALAAAPTLDLSGKLISDLRPIALLPHLTALKLGANAITDVSALAGLTALTSLDLSTNSITDIRPVAPLVRLTSFNATGNPIAVGDYLSACLMRGHEGALRPEQAAEVAALFDAGGGVSCHASALELGRALSVAVTGKGLTTVDYLPVLESVETLDLSGNALAGVAPLAGLPRLARLRLDGNQIGSIAALGPLTGLQALGLAGNPINSLSGIQNFRRLRSIDISRTGVSSVRPLLSLTELSDAQMRNLNINYTGFDEYCLVHRLDSFALGADRGAMIALEARMQAAGVDPGDCTAVEAWAAALQVLNLNKQGLSSIRPLRFLTELRELHLFDNRISDVGPLVNLTRLQKLSLASNQLSSLPAFNMPNLTTLYLSDNALGSVGGLPNLGALTVLHLDGNQIANPTPLVVLGRLQDLDLRNNRVAGMAEATGVLPRAPYLSGNPVCNLRINHPQLRTACTKRRMVVLNPAVLNNAVIGRVSSGTQLHVVRRDLCGQPDSACPVVRVGPGIGDTLVNP